MEIFIARHGESLGNIERIYFQDSGLSENGRAQTEIMADKLKNLGVTQIFTSSAKRAQETANILGCRLGIGITVLPDLKEYIRPSILDGKSLDEPVAKDFEKQRINNISNPDWKLSDDESFNDLKERANRIIKQMINSGHNPLFVSHGTFIKTILSLMVFGEKVDFQTFWNFRKHISIQNASLSVCSYDVKSGWKILSVGQTS